MSLSQSTQRVRRDHIVQATSQGWYRNKPSRVCFTQHLSYIKYLNTWKRISTAVVFFCISCGVSLAVVYGWWTSHTSERKLLYDKHYYMICAPPLVIATGGRQAHKLHNHVRPQLAVSTRLFIFVLVWKGFANASERHTFRCSKSGVRQFSHFSRGLPEQ